MLKEISIHTPAWGVTIPLDDGINGVVNFNPHARVGRDTKYADEYHLLVHISIHTPAWGVTLPSVRFSPSYIYFNPHARVGRDFERIDVIIYYVLISIHTPAWGVTAKLNKKLGDYYSTFTNMFNNT